MIGDADSSNDNGEDDDSDDVVMMLCLHVSDVSDVVDYNKIDHGNGDQSDDVNDDMNDDYYDDGNGNYDQNDDDNVVSSSNLIDFLTMMIYTS